MELIFGELLAEGSSQAIGIAGSSCGRRERGIQEMELGTFADVSQRAILEFFPGQPMRQF
jgi:hypothetical protein